MTPPLRCLRLIAPLALLLLAACGGGGGPGAVTPTPEGLARAQVDTLWSRAMREYRRGSWSKAATLFERVTLEVPAGDSLAIAANFYLAESYFGSRNQLQAARQFRKVSDDFPTSPLAAEALLRAGDAYADLWRRPELDDSYAQTAKATYQELLNRYPDAPPAARARMRIADLEEWFAVKEYKAAQYYLRLKAYDSAILYLKDIAATYPRAAVTPTALLRLVEAYRSLGYAEDRRETCGYIRRFHPTTPGLEAVCPAPRDSAAAP
ncbi:MAG: outer membrane protein assembly factor BamD [Gemmatimonadota bacterium]|nr:outer membrane protein assembly factor BamD [Gemmatimonadota bacterium]